MEQSRRPRILPLLLRKWLVILPVMGLLAALLTPLMQEVAETWLAETVKREARLYGVDLAWDELHVGFARIELEAVTAHSDEWGHAQIALASAELDIRELIAGRPQLTELRLVRPVLSLHVESPPEGRASPSGPADVETRRPRSVPRPLAAGLGPSLAMSAVASQPDQLPIDRIVIVAGRARAEFEWERERVIAEVEDADLEFERGLESFFVTGDAHVRSTHLESAGRLHVEGELSHRGDMMAMDFRAERRLALHSPVADVSVAGFGFKVAERARVWIDGLEFTPHLLDFTGPWRADGVEASMSWGRRVRLDRVGLTGLEGEVDLMALSEFADWLSNEEDSSASRGLRAIRRVAREALAQFRGGLYAEDTVVDACGSDVRLRAWDGSVRSIHDVNFALGGSRRRPTLKVGYSASSDQDLISGLFEVAIGRLTPEEIARWSR